MFAILSTSPSQKGLCISRHRSWGAGVKKWGNRSFCVLCKVPDDAKVGHKYPKIVDKHNAHQEAKKLKNTEKSLVDTEIPIIQSIATNMGVMIHISYEPQYGLNLENIVNSNGDKGAAGKVIESLCFVADNHKTPIYLRALDKNLENYYKQYGFHITDNSYNDGYEGDEPIMVRTVRTTA